jgi:hypothetical protein
MSDLRLTAIIADATTGLTRSVSNVLVATSGDGWDCRRLTVAHGAETEHEIDAAIATPGLCMVINSGPTNYLRVGFATTEYTIRIPAGQAAVFPLEPDVASLFLRSNVAPVGVEVYVREA